MEHLNLVRKIAWSFHRTNSGVDWNELFAEATLGYLEAVRQYDADKNNMISPYYYKCITARLIEFLKKERRSKNIMMYGASPWGHQNCYHNSYIPFFEFFEELCDDSQTIAKIVLDDPHTFLEVPSKMARGLVAKKLINELEWTVERTRLGIKKLKSELVETH